MNFPQHFSSALRSPLSALRSPLSALRSPLSALRSPLSALRSPLSALRSPLSALRSPLSALRSPLSALRSPLSALRSPLSALRSPLSALRSPLSALRSPLSALRSPLSALRSPLSALRSPLSALRSPLSALRSPLSALRSPLSALRSPLSALRSPLSALRSPLSALRSPLSVAKPLLLIFALFALAGTARAQESAENKRQNMEEIVVTGSYIIEDRIDTATGLGLATRETPQSVSVITAQRILDQNLDTVADVIVNATGVSVSNLDDVRNNFHARGFKIANYQIDGVPLAWTLAGGAGETMADVSLYERIEIVRGATGLLTGAGEPSASINLVRKHADSKTLTGYLNAQYGRYNNRQVSADIAGALTRSGAVRGRAVLKYQRAETHQDLFKDRKLVGYGVLEADLGPDTLFRAGISHQREKPTAPMWGALPSFYSDGSFTNWPRSKTSSANWTYWNTTNQNAFARIAQRFRNNWELTFNYNRLLNAQQTEILYLSGQVNRDSGRGLGAFPYSDRGESVQHSFDIQLQGDYALLGSAHEFVLGALHSFQDRENTTYTALAFPPVGNFNTWDGASYPYPGFSEKGQLRVDEKTKQTGFYGATRLNVTDRLKLIGGARLAAYARKGVNFATRYDINNNNVFIPYAGALFDLSDRHRLYASYTEIFQPQNARDRNGALLAPITGKNYEIGLKSAFLDEALQTSLALFRIEQDNLAQPDSGFFVPNTTPPAEASRAADGATSQGFEIEIVGRLREDWNLSLGYSQFQATDAKGGKVNTDHPRKLLNLFTSYRLPGALNGLVIGGGVSWRSENYKDIKNPVTGAPFRLQQNAYALVGLMARYEIGDSLAIQTNIDNLLDETYYSQIGFFSQYRYGAPRHWFISLNYAF